MSYTPYYPGGWKAGPGGGTPISAAALQHMDDGIAAAIPNSEKGQPGGVATLGPDGLVPRAQLPVRFATGQYVGDRTDGREIVVGFRPDYVKVFRIDQSTSAIVWDIFGDDPGEPYNSINHRARDSVTPPSLHRQIRRPYLSEQGFIVGTDIEDINGTGTFKWLAWGAN